MIILCAHACSRRRSHLPAEKPKQLNRKIIMKSQSAAKMWLNVYILAVFATYSASCVEITPRQSVFSMAVGSRLQVNCSSPDGVEWSSTPAVAMTRTSQNKVEGSVEGSDNISTLTFDYVQAIHKATYRCKDVVTSDEVSFQLRVFTVKQQEALYEYSEDAWLQCSVEENKTFTYTWFKAGVPVKNIKVDGKERYIEHDNGTLEMQHPRRNFAGLYTCVAEYEEAGVKSSISVDVPFYAHPKVLPFDKSKNLVQDETMVIECKVLGYPKPVVSWYRDNMQIVGGADSRYALKSAKTYDGASIDGAKLEILEVQFEDAGEYTCMSNYTDKWPQFNSTQIILVRVKDKLAALWPFLGIVAEVVVLCAIIFIYEKKRSKDAPVEEDTNQETTSEEKKAEGVRHRASPNNPRA